MRIAEKMVEEVVLEVSQKMSDPGFTNVAVGSWIQEQPAATQYIKAHVDDLGGAEGVINAVFHAYVLASCFKKRIGRSLPAMTFADMDAMASFDDRDGTLGQRQPALLDYVTANVEHLAMRRLLTLLALTMDYVS